MSSCRCWKNGSKKTIVRFINRKHAKKALIGRKKRRNNSSPTCNVSINENLTVKNNEIAFLGRKRKHGRHANKIYTKDGTVHVYNPELRWRKLSKIYHVNDLFSLFPYYDFAENYRENGQKDSIQSRYWFIL